MSVSIEISQGDSFWVLAVSGELDYGQCSAFRMQIDRVLRATPPGVVVDLSGLEYLDSSGLGLLLSLSREYGALGGRLVLVTNPTLDSILEITRLGGIFSTAANLSEAQDLLADTRAREPHVH
jgi:anti-sigma B factor antagonist